MRAGPLSNSKVIALLNRYFVPVYSSNEDTNQTGTAPPEEKSERSRIYNETAQAKLPLGDVNVYVLGPDGHPVDALGVVAAMNVDQLTQMLERVVQRLHTAPGAPVVKPTTISVPPTSASESLVMHLTARRASKGSWGEFPSENWLILSRPEWSTLLPTDAIKVGSSWDFSKEMTARLLTKFYPQTEETSNADRNRIDHASLKATVVSIENGMARARLDGTLKMKHTFYPGKQDNNFVNATLLGFMDFEPDKHRIETFRLVTSKATYGAEDATDFGAALRSMPAGNLPGHN